MTTETDAAVLAMANERIEELEQLVRWLAMPYGDNYPIFATQLPNGDLLETGIKLRALYRSVVGEEKQFTPGAWWTCPTCEMRQIKTPPLGESGPVATSLQL